MIRLLLEPVNLLILDEPTNHLDIPSKEVLKEAIKAFDGTAIIVSHDREFLDGLVTKVYEFGHGQVHEHIGGIYDYLKAHNAETINEAIAQASIKPAEQEPQPVKPASSGKEDYAAHKEHQKKLRKAQRAVEDCEKRIATMEARLKELDSLFMDPKNASDMDLVTEYTSTKQALDKENDKWLELSEEVEKLSN